MILSFAFVQSLNLPESSCNHIVFSPSLSPLTLLSPFEWDCGGVIGVIWLATPLSTPIWFSPRPLAYINSPWSRATYKLSITSFPIINIPEIIVPSIPHHIPFFASVYPVLICHSSCNTPCSIWVFLLFLTMLSTSSSFHLPLSYHSYMHNEVVQHNGSPHSTIASHSSLHQHLSVREPPATGTVLPHWIK